MADKNNPLDVVAKQIGENLSKLGDTVAESSSRLGERISAIQGMGPTTGPGVTRALAGMGAQRVLQPSGGSRPLAFADAIADAIGDELSKAVIPVATKKLPQALARSTRPGASGATKLAGIASRLWDNFAKPFNEFGSIPVEVVGKTGGGKGKLAGAAGGIAARMAANPVGLAVAIGAAAAAFQLWVVKSVVTFGKRMDQLSGSIAEANRKLAIFHPAIALSTIQLDRQRHVQSFQLAQATSGSSVLLGRRLMELRKDLQPMREAFGTAKNIGGAAFAFLGEKLTQGVNNVMKPLFILAKAAEKYLDLDEDTGGHFYLQFLDQVAKGEFNTRRRPPGQPPGGRP